MGKLEAKLSGNYLTKAEGEENGQVKNSPGGDMPQSKAESITVVDRPIPFAREGYLGIKVIVESVEILKWILMSIFLRWLLARWAPKVV